MVRRFQRFVRLSESAGDPQDMPLLLLCLLLALHDQHTTAVESFEMPLCPGFCGSLCSIGASGAKRRSVLVGSFFTGTTLYPSMFFLVCRSQSCP